MTGNVKAYTSYVSASGTYGPCADGFPQTAACYTGTGIPKCCQEEFCGRHFEQWGGNRRNT